MSQLKEYRRHNQQRKKEEKQNNGLVILNLIIYFKEFVLMIFYLCLQKFKLKKQVQLSKKGKK